MRSVENAPFAGENLDQVTLGIGELAVKPVVLHYYSAAEGGAPSAVVTGEQHRPVPPRPQPGSGGKPS